MRALQQTSSKGPQDMCLVTDAPVPSPGQGEVLIRVAAAGGSFADISRAHGTFGGGPEPPFLAGFEAAGEVVAVGEVGETVTGPYDGPDRPASPVAPGEVSWLEPLPDRWIAPADDDPAVAVIARESVRLALVASLQHLPARQRAILVLREVLAFSAAETAAILGTTTAAVKSGLQRARAGLDELEPAPEELLEPTDPRARALLDGYIAAFERSDASLLEHVLRTDATLEATPFRDWQAGQVHCIHMLDTYVLGTPGDWQMTATTANGQPAAAVYHREADGTFRANGIVVLAPTATGVSQVTAFHDDPALVVTFGFPAMRAA